MISEGVFLGGALAAVALGSAAPAFGAAASNLDQRRTAVVQAVSDCRKLADQTVRLACYDKAVDALDTAQAKGDVVVIDREQAQTVRRQAFGFSIPSFAIFNRGPKEEPIDQVVVDLSDARQDERGKWVMTTTDGAEWRQSDGNELSEPPRRGSKLLIKSGLLGSFFCKVDGQVAIRCLRDR